MRLNDTAHTAADQTARTFLPTLLANLSLSGMPEQQAQRDQRCGHTTLTNTERISFVQRATHVHQRPQIPYSTSLSVFLSRYHSLCALCRRRSSPAPVPDVPIEGPHHRAGNVAPLVTPSTPYPVLCALSNRTVDGM